MNRREFVAAAAAASANAATGTTVPRVASAFVPRASRRGASRWAEARIDVLLEEPIGTIAPETYGHFVEHLGGVVYDGVWVGEDSRVPNVGGVRKALIDALAAIRPAVVRWPGGCFADSYDWRDGVGPRSERPRRTNFWADDEHLRSVGTVPAV